MAGCASREGERAEAEIARPDTLITLARADLAPAAGMRLIVGFMDTTEFWIWDEDLSAGQFFREPGLDFRGGEDPVMTVTSLEQLSLLGPAEILLSVLTDPAATGVQEASPLADSVSPFSLAWAPASLLKGDRAGWGMTHQVCLPDLPDSQRSQSGTLCASAIH